MVSEKQEDHMTSRDKILSALRTNQPDTVDLPIIEKYEQAERDNFIKFSDMLRFIGGQSIEVSDYADIIRYIRKDFNGKRIVSNADELKEIAEVVKEYDNPHSLEDISIAILKAHFGVAENGAVWITSDQLPARVLPFISEYLAVIIEKNAIVSTLQEAYDRIASQDYGFGVFIAGPSKTSDIEQSLVLGAHGPKGMTVFIMA